MLKETTEHNDKVVAARLPQSDYKQIEKLVHKGKWLNSSDFIRAAVKLLLEREKK